MAVPQKPTRTKTRRRKRDIDQIISDLRSPKHLAEHKASKVTEDLPGLGQWYCIECAKWFEGENSLVTHRKGNNHKRHYRVKASKSEPYTQKEAEAAIGLRTDNGPRHTSQRAVVEMDAEMMTAEEVEAAATI